MIRKIKSLFLFVFTLTFLTTNSYSMGAKKPTMNEVKPVVSSIAMTIVNQALSNVLPLYVGNISPLLSTVLPAITRFATNRLQTRASTTVETFGGPYLEHIKELAETSSCAEHVWQNGLKAPAGLIKGMALSYARSSCRLMKSDSAPSALVNILATALNKKNILDGLLKYKNIFNNLGLSLNRSGAQPLRAVYLLNLGTSVAESEGAYCNDGSATSKLSTSVLAKLMAEYKGGSALRCFTDVFTEGTNCKKETGPVAYSKACPAFGAEAAAALLRVQGLAYQSVNENKAEIAPACDELLKDVQSMIDQDPENACGDIF